MGPAVVVVRARVRHQREAFKSGHVAAFGNGDPNWVLSSVLLIVGSQLRAQAAGFDPDDGIDLGVVIQERPYISVAITTSLISAARPPNVPSTT